MISWVLAFVIGRVVNEITWKPLALILALSLGLTFLFRSSGSSNLLRDALVNLVGFSVAFAAGHAFGRWWDKRKDAENWRE